MNQDFYEEYLKSKQERNCYNCKFYDTDNLCCMYDCACRCILSESESAQKCDYFTSGEYNQNKLEKTDYK